MKRQRHLRAGREQAFTLVEVICVSLLLAVLAAFLLPTLGGVRAMALSGKCVQKQKHIYMALLAFVEDHQGLLPPDLGKPPETTEIHPRFNLNQYWWDTNYLGRYVLNQPDRKRDSAGKLIGADLIPFQCPASKGDRGETGESVTYLMQKLFQKRENYQFRSMENKSRKLFLTEGKGSTLVPGNALTGEPDSPDAVGRLRRYHNGGLNILFFDGHIERFTGDDSEIAPLLKSGSN